MSTTAVPRTTSGARSARAVGVAGLVAVGAYLAATAVGGVVHPGYSHVRDSISELTSSAAPHRLPLAVVYVGYNLACAAFGWALRRLAPRSRLLRAIAWLSVAGAVAGIGQVTWFPQDTIGPEGTSGAVTTAGQVHLALAGVSAAITVATTILAGLAFRRDVRAPYPARVSFWCAAAILVTGPVAALAVGSDVMGLAERLPIGCFLVWLTLVSAWALRAARPV
jgi:hypothetical protein